MHHYPSLHTQTHTHPDMYLLDATHLFNTHRHIPIPYESLRMQSRLSISWQGSDPPPRADCDPIHCRLVACITKASPEVSEVPEQRPRSVLVLTVTSEQHSHRVFVMTVTLYLSTSCTNAIPRQSHPV